MFPKYDVIVVGAGHAGCEAAVAAANMGSKVLLVTMNMQTIGQMSCNPAMGGVAKGQIVREIDALGGYSGIVTDKTTIQFRMLNRSKGPAMWSPRSQNDRFEFAKTWRIQLEAHPNIDFWQEMIKAIIVKDGIATGVVTSLGIEIKSDAVILTNGTFLNGLIHIGEKQFGGGRAGENKATGITEQLVAMGFESGRMKTGTPPRVDGRSLNWSAMEIQLGDENPSKFSYGDTEAVQDQLPCHITYTNEKVHEVLKSGFDQSPMFNGRIKGIGPRYCPSIEDKIDRFSDKDRHQLFIEPEGRDTCEIYVNGFSSSLSEDVQYKALKLIPGFENVRMFRPGYAIEYDFFPPTQLKSTLETHLISNLYFAGQINGTTGYEEAACQGLMAGINAHLKINELSPCILKRSDAYIGVLIDDLVNKGTNEPYRMFTSRAEYRLLLRQDNADIRLTPIAYKLGIKGSDLRMDKVRIKEDLSLKIKTFVQEQSANPDIYNEWLESIGSAPLKQKIKLISLLSRPHIGIVDMAVVDKGVGDFIKDFSSDLIGFAETELKYEGYIQKEEDLVKKMNKLEDLGLDHHFDYSSISSLSLEARQKLSIHKPATLGQASRISGVSPSDVSILLIHLAR